MAVLLLAADVRPADVQHRDDPARHALHVTREGDETIEWAQGEIDTERWHRRSDDGKTDGYVWLAPSLHYVPVKMRVVATNRGTLEALLDSIRVDEPGEQRAAMTPAPPGARRRRRSRGGDRRPRAPLPAPADALLHQFFRRHPAMGQQDRAFVAEGVFAWLRRRRSLELLAGTTHPSKLALAVAVRERGYSLRDLEPR